VTVVKEYFLDYVEYEKFEENPFKGRQFSLVVRSKIHSKLVEEQSVQRTDDTEVEGSGFDATPESILINLNHNVIDVERDVCFTDKSIESKRSAEFRGAECRQQS
jgi:hypothetical protein